jgi:YD repeat-containing protein
MLAYDGSGRMYERRFTRNERKQLEKALGPRD